MKKMCKYTQIVANDIMNHNIPIIQLGHLKSIVILVSSIHLNTFGGGGGGVGVFKSKFRYHNILLVDNVKYVSDSFQWTYPGCTNVASFKVITQNS